MPEWRGDEAVRRAHRLARGDYIYPPETLLGAPARAERLPSGPMMRLSAPLASLVLAVAIAGCGGSSGDKQAELPKQQLIGSKQENRYPAGSPKRALMEYWAALQYKAWAQALSFYDPKLRDYVGSGRIVAALSAGASTYQVSAPNP